MTCWVLQDEVFIMFAEENYKDSLMLIININIWNYLLYLRIRCRVTLIEFNKVS